MAWRRYRPYKPGEFYVVFADTAWGGTDYCATQFLSKTNLDVPVVYHSKVLATEMTPLVHSELERIHDETGVQPVVAFERNNGGVGEIERLATLNRLNKYKIYLQKVKVGTTEGARDSTTLGWDTHSGNRSEMLKQLKNAIDNKALTIYDRPTINEMFSFVVNQKSSSWKAEAEQGAHDDLIMSLAGAWQLYQTENPPAKKIRTRERRPRAKLHV